jgi:predicted DNA-binding protein (MmcQ/YjbR family)
VSRSALPRVRKICLAFPEAQEIMFGGHTTPTFRVRNKIFAMYAEAEGGGHAVWCKAPPGAQRVLVGADPDRFFAPPYVGPKGWIGVRLDAGVDWPQLTDLIADSYAMTAPKRLLTGVAATTAGR